MLQDLSGSRTPATPYLMDRNRASVTFLDNQRLVVHEISVDTGRLSSRQDPAVSSPFRLQASILDANSGKLLVTRDWGTRANESSVQVVNGGVLIQTGGTLRLLSRDLEESEEVTVPMAAGDPSQWDRSIVSVSVTGKTLMVNRFSQKKNVSRFDVLDGTTLKPKYSWYESPPLYGLYSISDFGIASADSDQQRIIVEEFASKHWNRVRDNVKLGCVGIPTLVTGWSLPARNFHFCRATDELSFRMVSKKANRWNGRSRLHEMVARLRRP